MKTLSLPLLSLVLSLPNTLTCKNMPGKGTASKRLTANHFAPLMPPNLQVANLEEGGGVWSALDYTPDYAPDYALDYAPVLPNEPWPCWACQHGRECQCKASQAHGSQHMRSRVMPAMDTAPILAKLSVGLTGKTEGAAAAMHDTLEPRARDGAGHRPEALPHHGEHRPETPPQGRLNDGGCGPKWLLHKS